LFVGVVASSNSIILWHYDKGVEDDEAASADRASLWASVVLWVLVSTDLARAWRCHRSYRDIDTRVWRGGRRST
jgi:hypothetical protein